jgi:glutamate---cysteine ligase / carboxylate-amine ligase
VSVPTFGIEEEFLLGAIDGPDLCEDAEAIREKALSLVGDGVDHELRAAMIETGTAVCATAEKALRELTSRRTALRIAAADNGARVLATATHPLASPTATSYIGERRYEQLAERYGPIADQALVCGAHVHVQVPDRDSGVRVLDRIRPWLAPLVALSANSPFWQGHDTTYDSWRSRIWSALPTAGPSSMFHDLPTYEQRADDLIATGSALDRGMLYYEARLSERWPTVEVRVADVCLEAEDAVLLGLLVRGLVMTALSTQDEPAADVSLEVLRSANFTASREGLRGRLVDPSSWQLQPAEQVVERLVQHVSLALEEAGDAERVNAGVGQVLARGSGASQQRAAWESGGPDAVLDRVTLA